MAEQLDICSICKQEIKPSDKVCVCENKLHRFHCYCMGKTKFLKKQLQCPYCEGNPFIENVMRIVDSNKYEEYNESNFKEDTMNIKYPLNKDICSLCQDDFKENDIRCLLPCYHIFHCNEILDWYSVKKTCPICRNRFNARDIKEIGKYELLDLRPELIPEEPQEEEEIPLEEQQRQILELDDDFSFAAEVKRNQAQKERSLNILARDYPEDYQNQLLYNELIRYEDEIITFINEVFHFFPNAMDIYRPLFEHYNQRYYNVSQSSYSRRLLIPYIINVCINTTEDESGNLVEIIKLDRNSFINQPPYRYEHEDKSEDEYKFNSIIPIVNALKWIANYRLNSSTFNAQRYKDNIPHNNVNILRRLRNLSYKGVNLLDFIKYYLLHFSNISDLIKQNIFTRDTIEELIVRYKIENNIDGGGRSKWIKFILG
jgi:hypothetical protein